jgi:hypothetical protein
MYWLQRYNDQSFVWSGEKLLPEAAAVQADSTFEVVPVRILTLFLN